MNQGNSSSVSRAAMASVIAIAVLIDSFASLPTKVGVIVFVAFLLAHIVETLFRTLASWVADSVEERADHALKRETEVAPKTAWSLRGPLPAELPAAPPAETPEPERPEPSQPAPTPVVTDWDRLSREPAYKRKYSGLATAALMESRISH